MTPCHFEKRISRALPEAGAVAPRVVARSRAMVAPQSIIRMPVHFWQRALEIEELSVIVGVLDEAGIDTAGFAAWTVGEGCVLHDRIRARAEQAGVAGVPTFLLDGELFRGREYQVLTRLRRFELGLVRSGVEHPLASSHAWRQQGGRD